MFLPVLSQISSHDLDKFSLTCQALLLHKQLSESSLFAWCGVDAATPTGTKARGHFTATPANVPGVSRLCKAKGWVGLGPNFEPQHLLSAGDMHHFTCLRDKFSLTCQALLLHKQLSESSLFAWCGVDAATPTGTKARGHFTATLRPVLPAKLSGEGHRAPRCRHSPSQHLPVRAPERTWIGPLHVASIQVGEPVEHRDGSRHR